MKLFIKLLFCITILYLILSCENKIVSEPEPDPSTPTVIYPGNGCTNYEMGIPLSWRPYHSSSDCYVFDVYLGVNEEPMLIEENHLGREYCPRELEEETTYYWKIVAIESDYEIESAVWSFTTGQYPHTEMIYIEGGNFDMGDHFSEGGSSELPVHNVSLNDFYIGKYEITNAEYIAFMSVQYYNYEDNEPKVLIGLQSAMKYCNYKSIQEGLDPCYSVNGSVNPGEWSYIFNPECSWDANGYRLPTEAEWEYAARGGVFWEDNYKYSGTTENVENYAVHYSTSSVNPAEVGTKLPNQLGIHDMSGNVYEMCWDFYSEDYYENSANIDPHGPIGGTNRVIRGGPYYGDWSWYRVAYRIDSNPSNGYSDIGFRIVRISN